MSEECIYKDKQRTHSSGTAVKPRALGSGSWPSLSYPRHLDSTSSELSGLVSALDKDNKNLYLQKTPLTEVILLCMSKYLSQCLVQSRH